MTEIKQKILKAAFELFSEHSYYNTSIEKIAKRANVSKGAIFHHFNSKSDLAIKSLSYFINQIFSEGSDSFNVSKDPNETLKLLVNKVYNTYTTHPKLLRFLVNIFEITDTEAKYKKLWENVYGRIEKLLVNLFQQTGISNPKIRAILLLSCLDGLVIFNELAPETQKKEAIEDILDEIIQLFLK